jgi:hypothetical protein
MPKRRLWVIGRRRLLQWAGGAVGASALPGLAGGCSTSSTPKSTGYFSDSDAAVLEALADAVIPPDDLPGGSQLGVVSYIETLLTAFDSDPPLIYAGGPNSGREAVPSSTGAPSSTFPPDDFSNFLPLDRFQTKAWQLRIFGSAGVTGGGPNDAVAGPVIGLRDAVATAISDGASLMPAGVAASDLTQDDKTTMLGGLDRATLATFVELVIEAAFTAPEYGGNPGLAGWQMCNFEGDSQPVGYSWFDPGAQTYTEDPNHPVSTPNPYPDPMPMDATTEAYLSMVVAALGGRTFS